MEREEGKEMDGKSKRKRQWDEVSWTGGIIKQMFSPYGFVIC